jgi:hypothetical protein
MIEIRFSDHAARRMFQWYLTPADVTTALSGEVIESYPDDRPYPSRLVLGWLGGHTEPVHVLTARMPEGAEIIITVYRPDPNEWDTTFRERR